MLIYNRCPKCEARDFSECIGTSMGKWVFACYNCGAIYKRATKLKDAEKVIKGETVYVD